jgi:hypothetical protein
MSVDHYCNSTATSHQHDQLKDGSSSADNDTVNTNPGQTDAFPQLDWLTLEGNSDDQHRHDYDENDACSPTEHSDDEDVEPQKISATSGKSTRAEQGSAGGDEACSAAAGRPKDHDKHRKSSTECEKSTEHQSADVETDVEWRHFGHAAADMVGGPLRKQRLESELNADLSGADDGSVMNEAMDGQVQSIVCSVCFCKHVCVCVVRVRAFRC